MGEPARGAEVAPGVFRLGSRRVNWYAIHTDTEGITLVDAGLPRHIDQLRRHLAYTGHELDSIRAVVLTHAHSDHIGLAGLLATGVGAAVHVHGADAPVATGAARSASERGLPRYLLRPALLAFYRELVRGGIRDVPTVPSVSTFGDAAAALPAALDTAVVPGHTAGSTAFVLASRDVVFTGDALVTLDCATGATGPTVMPALFSRDTARSREALHRLASLPQRTVLPGHGQPWTDGLASAVALASQRPQT